MYLFGAVKHTVSNYMYLTIVQTPFPSSLLRVYSLSVYAEPAEGFHRNYRPKYFCFYSQNSCTFVMHRRIGNFDSRNIFMCVFMSRSLK